MAWDTERTMALLLAAATKEFSDKGRAGARMDRIAQAAGVNKERIYKYFGKKDDLFNAVLVAQLEHAFEELAIEGSGVKALGEYAGRLFDRCSSDGTLARLLLWEGLESGSLSALSMTCEKHYSRTLTSLQKVLPWISSEDAAKLLLTVVTLCNAWTVLPQPGVPSHSDRSSGVQDRRALLVHTALILAESLQQPSMAAPK